MHSRSSGIRGTVLLGVLLLVGAGCLPGSGEGPAPRPDDTGRDDGTMEVGRGDEAMDGEGMMIPDGQRPDPEAMDGEGMMIPDGQRPDPEAMAEREESMTTTGAGVVEISVTASRFRFEPAEIRVRLGDRVRLEILSTDVDHGIGIPDFGVTERLSPGETTVVEFVADKTGRFTFFCNVFCGGGHGEMRGILIVE